MAITRVASTLLIVNHLKSLFVNSYGYNNSDPPSCRPPFSYIRAAAAAGGQKKNCFDLAENRAADSLWVGAYRYTRIKFASKLLWV